MIYTMYLEDVKNLDKTLLLSEKLFEELFSIESEFSRIQHYGELVDRAKELGIKTKFEAYYNAFKKDVKRVEQMVVDKGQEPSIPQNRTNISWLEDEQQLDIQDWVANDNEGVWIHTDRGAAIACPHPIIPIRVLRNAEEGNYKMELAFSIRGQIRTALVDKSVLASQNKILALADQSVVVNSVTAPYLVRYLSVCEIENQDKIVEVTSTSKLGWIKDKISDKWLFMPYDGQEIIFDNEASMHGLFNSIDQKGNSTKWYEFIKALRAKNHPELNVSLASSYASALIEPCGGLPFIVDLWGGTGIGKSVILHVISSVWGEPQNFMNDAKSTTTATEVKLNVLNSLPMCMDDLAQLSNSDNDFEGWIYAWCSGQPKARSNKELGLNKNGRWRNCIITNGERALATENMKGGAVNRIVDIEASGKVIFDGREGNKAVNFVRDNYGHSGKDWIDLLKQYGSEALKLKYSEWFERLRSTIEAKGLRKTDKQIMPMAFILMADELIERELFKDGIRLDIDYCISILKDVDEIDENKRAYEFIVSEISMNDFHFMADKMSDFDKNVPCWGFYQDENWVAIEPNVFDEMLKKGQFQPKSFKSWCVKEGLIDAAGAKGKVAQQFRIDGKRKRFIVFNIADGETTVEDFEGVTEEETPFF